MRKHPHMKSHMMVMLHADEEHLVNYELIADKYWQFDQQRDRASKSGNWWLLIQPFAVAGVEAVNRFLMRYQENIRKPAAFIIFFLFAIAGTLVWEAYLSAMLDNAKRSGRQIPEPGRETMQVWVRDIPGRLRKTALISAAAVLIIFALCDLFFQTGIPLFMTLAVAAYLVAYFIIASARPVALLFYWFAFGKALAL